MDKYFLLEKKYHKCAIPALEAFYNKEDADAALVKARENLNLVWASIGAVYTIDETSQDKDKQIAELQEKVNSLRKSNEEWRLTNQGNLNDKKRLEEKISRRNLQIKDLKAKLNTLSPKSYLDIQLELADKAGENWRKEYDYHIGMINPPLPFEQFRVKKNLLDEYFKSDPDGNNRNLDSKIQKLCNELGY